MYKMSDKSYLPSVEMPPEPEQNDYETEFDKDPNKPQSYTLKQRLDTDKVFKKKMKQMAIGKIDSLDVQELSPPENTEPQVEVRQITQKEIEGDKNLTIDMEKQPPPKKKRKMSQKQLDALARGRATSLAKRQAKKKAKMKEQEQDMADEPEPEPQSMPVPRELQGGYSKPLQVKQVAFKEEKPVNRNPAKVINPDTGDPYKMARSKPVTKQEIEDIMTGAIRKYDGERKVAKKEKKEREQRMVRDSRVTQQIQRALDPSNPDFFNDCFTFS